jgi:hypothetical protein
VLLPIDAGWLIVSRHERTTGKDCATEIRRGRRTGESAAGILAEIGTTQDRGTVSAMPDERTLRYYLAEGLLSPAAEKQGTASVFGYLHFAPTPRRQETAIRASADTQDQRVG